MNYFVLPFNLPDSPLIEALVGLLIWSIAAALVLLAVETACFLWLTVRGLRSIHHNKAVIREL
jgi:hypothetical protein